MVALRKKKEIPIRYVSLHKSKINLKKPTKTPTLKHFKIIDDSMLLEFEQPVRSPKDWDDECEMKEIFKNGLYRNRSNISMDTLDKSTHSECISRFICLWEKGWKTSEDSSLKKV